MSVASGGYCRRQVWESKHITALCGSVLTWFSDLIHFRLRVLANMSLLKACNSNLVHFHFPSLPWCRHLPNSISFIFSYCPLVFPRSGLCSALRRTFTATSCYIWVQEISRVLKGYPENVNLFRSVSGLLEFGFLIQVASSQKWTLPFGKSNKRV